MDDERLSLIRQVRQRLEALRRAGLDRIPRPPDLPERPRPPIAAPIADVRPTAAVVAPPPIAPPPVRPQAPAPPPPGVIAASLFEEPRLDGDPVPAPERPAALEGLAAEVASCTKCPLLSASRTRTVFGEGSPTARLMFVGEAPGADEDRTGRPFVGRAGTLLTDMITKGMGLERTEVYLANVLKSRPPENRTPLPDEVGHCLPFLERQIAIIRPEFLCLLGKVAVSALLETALPMNRLRGRWHRYRGIPTVVTWHPAYLLRNPAAKKETWDDLQMLMKAMGIKPPERKKPGLG
ncbi:MAG TPA: uracil-DNA glycosylase [Isosphaeraceae bacterium]